MKRIFIIFGIILTVCGGIFAQQSQLVPFQLELNGRLISSLDPAKLVFTETDKPQISNFATLTNLEYTDNGIKSVRGMSKITTSPLTTNPKIANMFQFIKGNPPETHVLVQAYDGNDANPAVFRHSTSTPATGSFTATALHTDASGASDGRFSDANIGHVLYCNGKETQVWGGLENKPGYFSIFDGTDPGSSTAWNKDYTEQIWNNLTDSENVATLKRVTFATHDVGIGSVTAYVAARLPLQGIKFYVGTPNTRTGTTTIKYWNGSTMTAVTGLVDNTASGGIPLAQTGTVAFNSTESTAKVKIIEGIYGYFYRVMFTNATDTATISQVTVDEPFQKLVDFWDGKLRTIISGQFLDQNKFIDFTTNVFKNEFTFDNSTGFDEATYIKLAESGVNDLGTTEFIYLGFTEKMQGFRIKMIPRKSNAVANTVLTVSYWDDDEWKAVSDLNDGTKSNGISFANDGNVTWTPLLENVEFKTKIKTESPLYYYRIQFSQVISSTNLFVYYIGGIPSQKPISNYKFGLNAQGRTWLFNDQANERNKSIVSNVATLNVFNGEDSGDPFFYGDDTDIQAAVEVHSKANAGSEADILVLKNNSSHLLIGKDPKDWQVIEISNRIGCNAPLTLDSSSIGLEFSPLQSKQIAIWQGNGGIYMWDSASIIPISDSISNYFDQTRPEAIELTRANKSRGFFETHDDNHYYRWLFSSKGTSTAELDTEMVFDLRRQGWFKMDRNVNPLQAGTSIVATDTGVTYAYGANDSGDLFRLANGTSFDGRNIVSVFETGDIPLSGNVMTESKLRFLRLIMAAKGTTTNSVTVTHYVDGNKTGQDFSMSPARTGFRLAMPIVSRDLLGTFHRFRCTMTANDEDRGFEPMALGGQFLPWRQIQN